ncbi:MAG TPA: TolC family protein [archaeon]|nr:TolC family protein [archaeon]
MKRSLIIIFLIPLFSAGGAKCQEALVLTLDQAIDVALHKSYTIKSYQEKKLAMQHFFNYYEAQFSPQLDFSVFTPSWNENVSGIQRVDGLPVYNSIGSMQYGSKLKFTYILPTGGNFALSSQMYRESLKTVLSLQDYRTLNSRQAYSSISLSFDQPIFTKNKLKENLEEARASYEKTSSEFTRRQLDIIYEVTKGFYALYKATREVEIAQEKLSNSEEAYRIAKLKGEAGRIPEGDVLIAEIAVAENRAALSERQGNLERTADDFKQLIGMSLDERIQVLTDLKYDSFVINSDNAIDRALKYRLEIQESELDIKLQEIDLDRAKRIREISGNISAYYDITGVSTIEHGSTGELFRSSFRNFVDRPPNRGITLTFSYPIFDWGRGSARVQQESANLREKELSLENLKTTIVREVRDNIRSVEEATNRLNIHEQNEQLAQRSYQISRMRFESGNITSQELGVEQERLADTQLAYLDAYMTYQLAVADLKRKTLWDFNKNKAYTIDYSSQSME